MKKNAFIIFLVSLWIILAAVFGIYDLEISKQIVNQNSGWAKFLENFGMIPGLLAILSGIYIYYSFIIRESYLWSNFKKIIFFLTITGLTLYLFDIFLSNLVTEKFVIDNFITFLIISFAINLLIIIILHLKQPIKNNTAINYSKNVLGMALYGYVFCIQVVKYFWGRVRFRELDILFSNFTPWFLPQGVTGFDSFPSGHAAMGFILFPLLILLSNQKEWLKVSVFILILLWAVVLALSRVVIGAHFASDVLFGSFFMIMSFLLLAKRYEKLSKDLK